MNEQSAHIVAPPYCMQNQSETEKDERYLEKITHWDTRSFSPNFPPSVHIDYPTKEERKDISQNNDRQWTIDWRCSIPNTVNIDIRNERQLQLPHSSYIQSSNNNRESYVVTSYSHYNEIDNSNDVSVTALPSNNLNQISSTALEQVYPIDSKLQIKNKKFMKPKYYVGETDWNYQPLDSSDQIYEQYENEIEKNSAINLSFTNEAQIYNKQKVSNDQQRNPMEVITDDQFNNWNVPNNKPLMGENVAAMPILEKIDKKSALDALHIEKASTFMELRTYTPPTEREMPVLEHMIESYGVQNKFKQYSNRGNFTELNVETSLYDDNYDKKAIYQDVGNNLMVPNSNTLYLPCQEKKINPRTQAIRNMKRMRTSLYTQNPVQQDKYEDDINTEDLPLEDNLSKIYHSHKKYKLKDKKASSYEKNFYNDHYLMKFQDFYVSSDINMDHLKKIGQEKLALEKLPESVFNEYKVYDYYKTESTVILPSDKDFPLKMTFRINRECNMDALKSDNFDYKNNQKFPPFHVASNTAEKISKKMMKSKYSISDSSNEFNDVQVSKFTTSSMSSNSPPIRLPLKLKIKLPNKDFLNYRQSVVESDTSDSSKSYEVKLRERKCLRERTSLRTKSNPRQVGKMRTKRSTVDYGPDAYYHLLNIDELWDVLDDDVSATKKQTMLAYPESKRTDQIVSDDYQSQSILNASQNNFQNTFNLPTASAEVLSSQEQMSSFEFQTQKEEMRTEIKTESNDSSSARKSILVSTKGEEIYDFVLQENMNEKTENFVSKQWKKENDSIHSDVLLQNVCDNNPEENQKFNTRDDGMSVKTKSTHSEFLDCDKLSHDRISYEGIAQSDLQVFPITKNCSNNYRQSVIFQHETQVQPLMLQKDCKSSEMDLSNETKDMFLTCDENKNQLVCESNISSTNLDNLEMSVCQKISPLNQEKI
ncbi:uncharacterized protein LOC111641623 [Centruroides sculpturatus]|uniref:uncharacterized protein LOC111641623 n=1 Tax=Centruroides sculpturatus TaxID=218467 RepID=UPI000C6D6BF3|nr:uncharacterized protein LOC111641623 [Centruroides sculpturatus]XP_023243591.1 uncharacterized protein LOC111641623 [Centruroides sculpturatus]XP_023243593.1 uncharacterized protein LOC111641623 [Centruroides sculpturatus]